jgi:hypothetical protein
LVAGWKRTVNILVRPLDLVDCCEILSVVKVQQSSKYVDLLRPRADYCISESKAKRMIADGRIKAIRLVDEGRSRGKLLIDVDELNRYLKSLSAA